jgi:hypothetical protein
MPTSTNFCSKVNVFPHLDQLDQILNRRVEQATSDAECSYWLGAKDRIKRRLVVLPDAEIDHEAAIQLKQLEVEHA